MSKIGIILDSILDKQKIQNIFKDASDVSLSFIETEVIKTDLNKSDMGIQKLANPKDYIDKIKAFHDSGIYNILIITSSKKMTRSYENALLAKDILKDIKVDIVDAHTFGPGIYYLSMCIKIWISKNYSYQKIKELLKVQVDKGMTIVVTTNPRYKETRSWFQNLLSPWVVGYLVVSSNNYEVKRVMYKQKNIVDILYHQILGFKGFKDKINIFVYSGKFGAKAKLLQHELYTKNKDLNITLYGEISSQVTTYFGDDMYGVYLGYYEEMDL